jgi:hypothetical protein
MEWLCVLALEVCLNAGSETTVLSVCRAFRDEESKDTGLCETKPDEVSTITHGSSK